MADSRRAWARALYDGLGDAAARGAVAEALSSAVSALRDPRVEAFFKDPAIPRPAKAEALSLLLSAAAAPAARVVYGRFASLIVERGRVALLPGIAEVFGSYVDESLGLVRLELTSARPLPEAVLSRIGEAWKAASGAASVSLSTRQDPALVGGFILRAGSVRYDWSTVGRLGRLGRELSRPLPEGGSERGK